MGRIDIDSYVGVDPFGNRDSTGALQQAIMDGEKDWATEYLIGPGRYWYQPQAAALVALTLRGSHLIFRARGRTVLAFHPGTAARGHGIGLAGGSSTAPQIDIAFEGIEMDGSAAFDPAAGWDTKNQAFTQRGSASAYYDDVRLRGCYLHHWCGEVVYGGGYSKTLGRLLVEDCEITDTNGDGISSSAQQEIRHNRIARCAANGIEDTYDQAPQEIIDNDVSDCGLDGIGVQTISGADPCGPSTVERNRLSNCRRSGVTGLGVRNAWVVKNRMMDCGWASGGHSPLYFDQSGLWQGSVTTELHVRDNDVVVDRQHQNRYLVIAGSTGKLDAEQPRVWRTAYALANGL